MASEILEKNMILWCDGESGSSSLTLGDLIQLKLLRDESSDSESERYTFLTSLTQWSLRLWGWSAELKEALEEVLNIWVMIVPWRLTTVTKTPFDQHWQCWVTLMIDGVGGVRRAALKSSLNWVASWADFAFLAIGTSDFVWGSWSLFIDAW